MLSTIMGSVYTTTNSSSTVNLQGFIWALLTAIVLGYFTARIYQFRTVYTKTFVITLALLPAVVATVITLVNGNLGAGVAVAGAFSLVRFRSAPGGAKEIYAVFLAMAIGLATGMGYLVFAILVAVVLSIVSVGYEASHLGQMPQSLRQLTVTIPENLDYETIFDDLFDQYLLHADLLSVRTSDMGSLFKLKYTVRLKKDRSEKLFLDQIRTRNGNLEVIMSRNFSKDNEL